MELPGYKAHEQPKSFPNIRVAVILDEFSLAAWSHEFDTVLVTPQDWHDQVTREPVDMLFVESAWAGNSGTWKSQILGKNGPTGALKELVQHCQESKIPTVFWNKEDPAHFTDFIETARLFDYVFTSDSDMLPCYREELNHDRVEVLHFAAQPAIHNPTRISKSEHGLDIAFAGMYFRDKFPERRNQMKLLLGAAAQVARRGKYNFDIYSRHHGGDKRYQFPKPFRSHVAGSLEYDQVLTAYRYYKVFLNVNSVADSPSMCARRVFEVLASGTPVVSARSEAITKLFHSNEVPVVYEPKQAELQLRALLNSPQTRDRMVQRAQRKIWANHTYTHRADQLFRAVGFNVTTPRLQPTEITAILSTNRPDFVRHAIESVARQKGVNRQLALLTHGFQVNKPEMKAFAKDLGLDDIQFVYAPSNETLGDCLNLLIDAADGDLIAKFDDDDFYARHYLLDSVNALRYSGAELVGKQAVYLYLDKDDVTILRNPDRERVFTDTVAGATFLGARSLFKDIRFTARPRGEDTAFLEELDRRDARIYSADRFNFLQRRGRHSHTWDVEDLEFAATGVVETYGYNPRHVVVDDEPDEYLHPSAYPSSFSSDFLEG